MHKYCRISTHHNKWNTDSTSAYSKQLIILTTKNMKKKISIKECMQITIPKTH